MSILTRCDNALRQRNIAIPEVRLAAIIASDREFVEQMKEIYPEEGDGLDTYERGWLMDMVAQDLGYEGWPCNGDSAELGARFRATLVEKGYLA